MVTQEIQSLLRLRRPNPSWSCCHPHPVHNLRKPSVPLCSSSANCSNTQSLTQHFQLRALQVLHKAWLVSCCHRGRGHSHGEADTEVMCTGAGLGIPQHVAGRVSTARGCEQHLVQAEKRLGLICWLVFTPQLSVSCSEWYSTKMPLVNSLLSGLVQLCTSIISLIPSVSGNVVERRVRVELGGCRSPGERPEHPTATSWPSLIHPRSVEHLEMSLGSCSGHD